MADAVKIRPLVIDGDKTLWKGRAAEGIGKSYLLQEFKDGHLITLARGIRGALQVKKIIRDIGTVEGEMIAQQRFYEILVENRIGDRESMSRYAKKYIDSHLIKSVSSLAETNLDQGIPVFLSTASGTSAAGYAVRRIRSLKDEALTKHVKDLQDNGVIHGVTEMIVHENRENRKYEFTSAVFNNELFNENGKLTGIDLLINTGERKLAATVAMLDRYDIKISDCTVIGDSGLDVPMLKAAGKAMASPFANDEVKAIRGIVQIRA